MDFTIKSESDKLAVISYVSRLPVGKEYEVSIDILDGRPKRTSSQNKLLWMWYGVIAKETGNDVETLHKVFCSKFLGLDIVDVMGQKIAKPKSSSKLKTDEMKVFLDQIEAFAYSELNIVLPHPDEITNQ